MKFENNDKIAEIIWTAKQNRTDTKEEILRQLREATIPAEILEEMIQKKEVISEADTYRLSEKRKTEACIRIRQHRLGEVVISQVLDADAELLETSSCVFEHSLVPEITDGICTLLGHPPKCPHGNPIPQGDCCKRKETHIESSAVAPLTELSVGEEARVAYIISNGEEKTLHFLNALGVHPGSDIKLHQTYPTYVIEQGNTQLAMEESIASTIFLWRGKKKR